MVITIGYIAAFFFILSYGGGIYLAYNDRYDASRQAEIISVLWLIVSILCFK